YDHYPVLLAEHELGSGSAVGRAAEAIEAALVERGLSVITAKTLADVKFTVSSNAAIGAALLDWDLFASQRELSSAVEQLHSLNEKLPVLLLAERSDIESFPLEVAELIDGAFWLHEDTPDFVAGRVERLVTDYADQLLSPFFGALKRYVDDYNWVWCCPGHNGGMFYRKTPLGRIFFDYVGEPFLRGDLCNASPELGSILQHQGPVLDAEQRAAEIFGAERTYFVLNGTSTSNKMVTMSLLAPGDLVLFDRNCHKSMHHGALMMAGAIPVYLNPTRDANGIIGPVDHRLLNEDYIRGQIAANPLVTDPEVAKKKRPFRLAILTNTTYDGVCYNEREVLDRIGSLCDYIIFDEAWMGYAKFHPLFVDRFGMSLENLGPEDPGIYTTQSTHKCLAGMSQASQIHVRDSHLRGQKRRIDHNRFNEIFMMHTSTSPQYNMIASLDVGAEIMRGRPGFALMDDAVRESIALRKQVEAYHDEIGARDGDPAHSWFFDIFGPHRVTVGIEQLEAALGAPFLTADTRDTIAKAIANGGIEGVAWRDVSDDILASVPECWMFHEGDDWHDLDGLAPGYVMLDPTKCSLTTPGIENGRQFSTTGIPAAVPAAVLRSRGIVNEKTSFYTILLLVTPAIERGKSATLLSELLDFKRAYDKGVALADVLPDLVAANPERYGNVSLRQLCDEMHQLLKTREADALQRAVYNAGHEPEIVLAPAAAHTALIRNDVELIPLDELAGRVAASLVVVYPPGIAIMVPGERFAADSAAVAYLRLFEENDNQFPGFETEMQGIFPRREDDGSLRYYTYVVAE
ncbi:MAG: Orn/Lys/Arg decarboxylase N-terminal domain-containing protein, partial [Acidimicrobiales bacterium]